MSPMQVLKQVRTEDVCPQEPDHGPGTKDLRDYFAPTL